MEQTKVCSKCGVEKGLGEFHTEKKEKLGVQAYCKLCKSEYSKKQHQKNRERYNERSKKWRENNRGYHNKRNREWNKNNKESVNKASRKWSKNNPLKVKAYNQNRRARKRSAQGKITSETYERLERWNHDYFMEPIIHCEYCSSSIGDNWHLEHIQPLSKGGSNKVSNLAIVCPRCNLSKHNKLLAEFNPEKIYYFSSRNFYFDLESLGSNMS